MILPTVIIVPGLGDSGPHHWQTLWQYKYGAARVRQDDPEHPTPQAWGALLVGPTDADQTATYTEYPGVRGMAPTPLEPLPFPGLVVASTDDPYATLDRAQAFARAWGAGFVSVGPAGHINAVSGHGEWREGEALRREAVQAWTAPQA